MHDVLRNARIGLPIYLSHGRSAGAPWHVDLDTGDPQRPTPFTAQGNTGTAARAALTGLITAAPASRAGQPVGVIGGPDYADCPPLILPGPHQWVDLVRDGRPAGTWHSDHSRDEPLPQLRDHVGGPPTVVPPTAHRARTPARPHSPTSIRRRRAPRRRTQPARRCP